MRLTRKGYESQGFVPEVHDCVAGDQRIHKAHHVMWALGALLRRHLVGDDVQALVNLDRKRNLTVDDLCMWKNTEVRSRKEEGCRRLTLMLPQEGTRIWSYTQCPVIF